MADQVLFKKDESKQYKQVGYEKLAVSSSAVALASLPATAEAALIVAASNAVRWRSDSDPSATDGSPLAANDSIFIESRDILNTIKFIRQTADATMHVSYFG